MGKKTQRARQTDRQTNRQTDRQTEQVAIILADVGEGHTLKKEQSRKADTQTLRQALGKKIKAQARDKMICRSEGEALRSRWPVTAEA